MSPLQQMLEAFRQSPMLMLRVRLTPQFASKAA
jgi:hypothetical protein